MDSTLTDGAYARAEAVIDPQLMDLAADVHQQPSSANLFDADVKPNLDNEPLKLEIPVENSNPADGDDEEMEDLFGDDDENVQKERYEIDLKHIPCLTVSHCEHSQDGLAFCFCSWRRLRRPFGN